MKRSTNQVVFSLASGAFVAAALSGCSGASPAGQGGQGAQGGAAQGGAGGEAQGGAGATGGGGEGGGAGASPCLPASAHEALFTIADPAYCAVALYESPLELGYSVVPTWGRHGGLLTMIAHATGDVTISRWQTPEGSGGALVEETENVPGAVAPQGFASAQIVDLPFFGWSVLGWSGAFPDTQGELVLVEDGAVAARFDVNGLFSLATLAGSEPDTGRVFYSGLSAVEEPAGAKNGLYLTEACGTDASPTLATTQSQGCFGGLLEGWGDASGPIALDADGNLFAVHASFDGTQEAKGWAAAQLAPGVMISPGASTFMMPGFGGPLAALAPAAPHAGALLFQPSDPTTFEPLDVVVQSYSVGAGGVTPAGSPTPLLDVPAGVAVALVADDQHRVWVGVPTAEGTTFVVLARP
jgi:hypothetical protein